MKQLSDNKMSMLYYLSGVFWFGVSDLLHTMSNRKRRVNFLLSSWSVRSDELINFYKH